MKAPRGNSTSEVQESVSAANPRAELEGLFKKNAGRGY
jgi:hypothetical protein